MDLPGDVIGLKFYEKRSSVFTSLIRGLSKIVPFLASFQTEDGGLPFSFDNIDRKRGSPKSKPQITYRSLYPFLVQISFKSFVLVHLLLAEDTGRLS